MHTLETLTWHPLPATTTYPFRQWAWVVGNDGVDHRYGTLYIRQRRSAGGKWDADAYGVLEEDPVGVPNPGRVFLLVNDTDANQDDVYEAFIADTGAARDRCTCRAVVCQKYVCKHTTALRALTTPEEGFIS